ncbi:hypothetical protein J2741_002085 [Methanolinea mesophila]|uniref:tetratricopeptide repeat protein n=1 Tax=Methanolinea mesophila TaxID=547055 RepID=UPI001AE93B85|nr:tetratricopeptide repeat protein [Methanolinea mesophila]MBP1929538.1 hypothetical protein [Methanolinea mesophila]
MRRIAVVTLVIIGIAVLFSVAPVIASDCGCGGLPDNSPPDGWDTPGSFSGGGGSDTGGGSSDSGSDTGGTGDATGGDQAGGDSGGSDGGTSGGATSDGGSDSYSSSGGDSGSYSGGTTSVPGAGSAEDAALLVSRARTSLQQGSYDESLKAFNMAIAADPGLMAAWMGKAEAEELLGNYADAVRSYTRAARLDPGDADPWVGIGTAYLAAGDYQNAIVSFDRALVIHPGLAEASEGLALADQLNVTVGASTVVMDDVTPAPGDDGQIQADPTGTSAPADTPGEIEAPGEPLSVSVPGSAPSLLPMLAAIMAFAVIMYRKRAS